MGNLSTFFPAASSSNVLEKLAFQCTGDSMTNSFGNTITSENVTSLQSGQTTTFTKINGSQIAYTPPAEATRVIYEFRVQIAWHTGTHNIGHMQCYIDGNAVTRDYHTSGGYYREDEVIMTNVIRIGSGLSDSNANATYSSWTSDKTLSVYGRGYSTSNYWYNYHNTHYSNGGGTDAFVGPKLIITALS